MDARQIYSFVCFGFLFARLFVRSPNPLCHPLCVCVCLRVLVSLFLVERIQMCIHELYTIQNVHRAHICVGGLRHSRNLIYS